MDAFALDDIDEAFAGKSRREPGTGRTRLGMDVDFATIARLPGDVPSASAETVRLAKACRAAEARSETSSSRPLPRRFRVRGKLCHGVGIPGKRRLSTTGLRANPNRKRRARMSGRAFWNCHSGREPRSSEPSARARPRRVSPGREPRSAARLGDAPEEGATCGPHPGPLRSDPRNRPDRRLRAGPRR